VWDVLKWNVCMKRFGCTRFGIHQQPSMKIMACWGVGMVHGRQRCQGGILGFLFIVCFFVVVGDLC
jgi:hypothetical protein